MGRLGCHTKGDNWEKGCSCKPKSLNFPLMLDITPTKKLGPPVPTLITDHILRKKVSLIAFRLSLPKILPAAYIFSNTIMTNLKKLIGNKSLNTKQCPAGLSPRIIPLHLLGNPGGLGEYQPTGKNLLTFPTRKILLDEFTSSAIKSVILSPSNSNFHLINLCKL